MKFIGLLALAASLSAAPIPAPDMGTDGLQVIGPGVGRAVIPNEGLPVYLVCLNDNPANAPDNDQDYNDACARAEFGENNVLKLTYLGGLSSANNYIGVMGQDGWVGSNILEAFFTYAPTLETIFAGYVNGGQTATYYSGTGSALSNPLGDYFYTECTLCSVDDRGGLDEDVATPEPAAVTLVGLGLAGLAMRRFRAAK